jgi:uncharacterized RDD family membrane protein YckC
VDAALTLSVVLSLATAAALAQPTTARAAGARWTVHPAADEQTLWIVATDGQRSVTYRRGVNEAFREREPLNAPVAGAAVSGGTLYAFVDDGAFYSLGPDGWSRERDLPGRGRPVDLVGDDTGVYALVPSPPAGQMQRVVGTGRAATTEPFDAGDAPLSLARYGGQAWVALAPCPGRLSSVDSGLRRIVVLYGIPCLLWYAKETLHIECLLLDSDTGQWRPGAPAPAPSQTDKFWVTTISRVPTLLVAVPAADGGQSLSALRLLGGVEGTSAEWRPATLRLSELPTAMRAQQFNQHAVLLMADQTGAPYLQYGRMDAAPTEATTSVVDVLTGRRGPSRALPWLHGVTLVILMGLLVALFVFRRGAMVAVLALPDGCTVALAVQRLVGFAIDMIPFAVAAAIALGVDWHVAARELFGWAFGGGATAVSMPTLRTLTWWGASCVTYTVYSLVMESLTRRTIGKTLVGTRVLAETGATPRFWQIVVRNSLRCLELLPPFWVLGFVVVLSRNRQRVGDIFARTIVARRARQAVDGE